ncbi:MAG: hypothetical protein R2856_10750 [Caldilineaceae bacterium]
MTAPAVAVGVSGPGELRIGSATLNYPEESEGLVERSWASPRRPRPR